MADSGYESVLCVKNEVFVYKIPPRPSNRGHKAADWKLDAPDWTGRLRVVEVDKKLFIKLEDSSGELFAQCPVEEYPSVAVESVMDSSRYFVIRIKDPQGRSAFIGIGFADRSDSFDLNVSLQDHFKWLKQEAEAKKTTQEFLQGPSLDLGFKAGQTITLNIGAKKTDGAKSKPKPRGTTTGFLPPPPGGATTIGAPPIKIAPPSASSAPGPPHPNTNSSFAPPPAQNFNSGFANPPANSSFSPLAQNASIVPPVSSNSSSAGSGSSNVDLLMDLGGSDWLGSAPAVAPTLSQNSGGDVWGDFTSAPVNSNSQTASSDSQDWVQFS